MIHVLDVLTVAPGRVEDVRRMMRDDYVPVVAALDMRLVHEWLNPAVELVDQPTELLYLWELDDVPGFWRMRTLAAQDPRVTAFWDAIARMLTSRDRKLMCDPADARGAPVIRTTAFVHLSPDAAPARVDELIDAAIHTAEATDAIATDASRVTNNAFRAGDVMLLGAFANQPALEHALGSAHVTEVLRPLLAEVAAHVEAVRYGQGATTLREPGLTDGIHRSLLIHVHPDTDPVLVGRFERELAAMPNYIDAIRNSSLSRIDTMRASLGPEYTHVWEQEFATLDGLTGPYMQHAYHWSVIDPWFDLQAPVHIVDPELIHSSCELRRSILALA